MLWCRVGLVKRHSITNFNLQQLSVIISLLFCLVLSVKSLEINLGILLMRQTNEEFYNSINSTIQNTKLEFTNTIIETSTIGVDIYNFTDEITFVTEMPTLFLNHKYSAVIAFTPQRYISMLGRFSDRYQTPLIIADNYYQFTDTDFIISMYNSFEQTSDAMSEYLEWFQWGTVAVYYSDEIYWKQMANALENKLMKLSFSIRYSDSIRNVSNHDEITNLVKQITPDVKAVILTMDDEDLLPIMNVFKEFEMLHNHAFFLVSNSPHTNHSYLFDATSVSTQSNPLESVFILCPKVPNYYNTSRIKQSSHTGNTKEFIFSLEDATATIFHGIVSSGNSSETNIDKFKLMQQIKKLELSTIYKHVIFDANYDRIFDFSLFDYDVTSNSFQEVRYISKSYSGLWVKHTLLSIQWPSGIQLSPDACFKNDNCETGVNVIAAVLSPVVFLFLAGSLSIVAVFIWRRRTKILMTRGPNKILLEQTDIVYLHRHDHKNTKNQNGTFLDKPDILKKTEKPNRSMASLQENSEFSEIARYKGDTVYLKELNTKGLEVKGKLLSCLRTLRDIRHENVNPLYGFLMDQLKPCLVYEYCSRGSLEDVIKRENMKLDWDFKLSLLTDLVRGLRYIQSSSIHYHGCLKSRNCVIDSRWVLKLTEFGINKFREIAKVTVDNEPRDLLWTAPEHLRGPCPGIKGSVKGDMYSLAIIMQEIILRSEPFSMTGLKPEEILRKISHPPPLLRPSVSPQAAQPQYIQIMKQCWAENPDIRPGIEDVYHQFKAISGGKKMNIVDSMFRMLEKYSTDLEDIVKDRTAELEVEKRKTDLLLSRMLPKTVAENLKTGKPVEAVEYSEVTIYFSDIVGFTTISAMSSPMEVVALLNDLYSMFDATIDIYDVYKVETIGDAYMVASGLPVPNGIRHAGEIGTMALDLLSQCGTFTIRHMPDVPLRLRIGLHTGPCVAGVVGLTMPRYCLFGDTVNTASRMESTGSAFRIHISNDTKMKLDELGGYVIEFRGEVELKGKGLAKTYWLIGKEGFTKPLPEPPEQTRLASLMGKMSERRISTLNSPVINNRTITETINNNTNNPLPEDQKCSTKDNKNNPSPEGDDINKNSPGKNAIEEEKTTKNIHDETKLNNESKEKEETEDENNEERNDKVSSSDCTITIVSGPNTPRNDCTNNALSTVVEV